MSLITDTIIHYTNPLFLSRQYSDQDTEKIDWRFLFKEIYQNNVDSIFLENFITDNPRVNRNIPAYSKISAWSSEQHRKYLTTIKHLTDILRLHRVKYVIFKSLSPYKNIKDDIDVWVRDKKDFHRILRILNVKEATVSQQYPFAVHIDKPDFTQIDLHPMITWNTIGKSGAGPTLLDLNDVWKRKTERDYYGMCVTAPSWEDEILILNAHAIFQHHYLTLGEIILIGEIIRNKTVDFRYIFKTAESYEWVHLLKRNFVLIKSFYKQFWNIELTIPSVSLVHIHKRLTYDMNLWDIMKSLFPSRQKDFRGFRQFIIGCLVVCYRQIYYRSILNELPFNVVPKDIQIIVHDM